MIAVFVLLLALFVFSLVSRNSSSPLSNLFGVLTEPFSFVTSKAGNEADTVSGGFRSKIAYGEEIQDLKKQILQYQKELADYEQVKQENELYRSALGVKEKHADFAFVYASVIGRDAADVYTSFTLSRGTNDGVAVNDPVICGEGQLVGLVTKVAATYCVVSTILDPKVSVSVYEVRTRESGYISNTTVLAGTGLVKVSGLSRLTSVTAGGVVCSSGVGGIFPKDLVVGTVKEVKDDDHSISSYITVKPTLDIKDVEDVLIITDFEGQGVATP